MAEKASMAEDGRLKAGSRQDRSGGWERALWPWVAFANEIQSSASI